jgi:ankyrin repeat protein
MLRWVSYPLVNKSIFRAESSVAYLLAWNSDVNGIDCNGLTPLHLAIKAAEDLKSSRSVRHLLIKGADRQIKDNAGRSPMDIVKEIRVKTLHDELATYLVSIPT